MSFPSGPRQSVIENAGLQSEAPNPHVEALLSFLEATDQAMNPLTARGMDGRTAAILKEIEKTGAISLQTEGENILIDVIDKPRALGVIDRLIADLRS